MAANLKIFLGCRVDSELRMLMEYTSTWKEEHAGIEGLKPKLVETQKEGERYIGRWLKESLSLEKLRVEETEILADLQHYFPTLNLQHVKLVAFSQLFIE